MELITGFTPGEGGEGAQVRRTRVETRQGMMVWCEGRSLSILSAMGVEVSSVASSFFPSILSSLHASLPPFNLLLIIFLLVFLESVLGLALLLEKKTAILYCYHAMLVAMPDTLLPISVQKSRSRQEKKIESCPPRT